MINNYKTIKQKASIKFSTFVFAILTLFSASELKAQLSGTKNIPGDYSDLASAITALNTQGVGAGGVTLNLVTANPQLAPAGGYVITATGTLADQIILTGNGNTITSSTANVGGALNDGIIKLVGADYVTIQGFTLMESAANTITTAGTNNMTEWGVALLYATATNGSQNCIIQNNTITLNRTYQNTFGIYANATHTSTAVATSATATGAAGGNSGLKIVGNTISNVNNGIVVVGPTAAADHNTSLTVSGNNVSDYGTTGTFSTFANVSGTIYGVLVRNTNNFNVVNNTISSSNGGMTLGTLRGIFVPAFSNAPTGTNTNDVSGNIISLRPGATGIGTTGIEVAGTTGNVTTTLTINDNDFNNFGHTVAGATGAFTFITSTSTSGSVLIQNNTFSNISVNTTGSVTFVNHGYTMPAAATQTFNNNRIVGSFAKTGAGGTITGFTSGSSSPNGSTSTITNNNLSNITVTGATTINGIANTDGAGSSPNRVVTGNTFSNWSGGTNSITAISFSYIGSNSSINSNTISNLSSAGNIVGINVNNTFAGGNPLTISSNSLSNFVSSAGNANGIVSSNASTLVNVNSNTIFGLSASFAGNSIGINITGGVTTTIHKNKIYDIQNSNASGVVMGIAIGGGTTNNVYNNIIGDLRTTTANAANSLIGLNISGGTTANVYYNTVMLNATSSGALFGSSAISASTTPALTLRNNIFINKSTANGAGITAAYRRSTTTLTSYNSASNNNLFYAGTPSASSVIFYDGTNSDQTIGAFKTRVTPSDALSVTEDVAFMSTVGSNVNFLHIANGTSTLAESGAVNIATYTDDFDANVRFSNPGYAGTSTTGTDIGADEFDGVIIPICSGAPTTGTISGLAAVCSGLGTNLTLTGASSDLGITYQWASSTTPGGPYTTILSTNSSQATGALTIPTYYIVTLTCSNSGLSATSTEKSVLINTLPTVVANPSTGTYCTPGGSAVAIAASGASTYAWLPAGGLSATSVANVNASPSATTTYTVTGTDVNGCIGTATSAITVGAFPIISSATATPSSVCSGANSQLLAAATVATNGPVSTYTFAGSTGTYTPIAGTVLGAGVIGDDVGIGNLPIGFTFNYNGSAHTVFGVRSNGYIELSQTTASLTNFVANSLATIPNVISPLWDDNNTTGGTVSYLTTGTAPNQILTIQYTGMHVGSIGSATNPTIDFQVLLYQATGQIQIIYGSTSAALVGTTASIGISGAVGNYLSVTPLSPASASTVSSTTENTTISAATNFPSGTIYTFTPPSTPASGYVWSPATFLDNAAIANPLASGITTSTVYTVTASSAIGCAATATISITAGAALSATSNVTPSNTTCIGSTITLQSVPVGGGGPFSYAWAGPNGFTSIQQDTTLTAVTAVQAGTYTVTITDDCGATTSSQVTLTINALPTVSVTPNSGSICLPGGSAVSLVASGAANYTWLPATGLSAATGANVSANPAASTTYTVTGTDANNCVATSTALISVSNNPTLTATATPTVVCTGGNSQLNANGSIPLNYCTASATSTNFEKISNVTIGTINNNSTATAGYEDFSAQTTSITAGVAVPVSISVSGAYASDDRIHIWVDNNQDGTFSEPTERLLDLAVSTFCPTCSGTAATLTGSITIPLTALNGSTKLRIRLQDNSFGSNTTSCGTSTYGQVEDYLVNVTGATNNPGITYSWSPATFLSDAAIANPSANAVTSSTVYTVTATSGFGCVATATAGVNVSPLSSAGVTAVPSTPICLGQSVVLSSTPIGGGPYTYAWTPGGATTSSITVNPTTTTDYTVVVSNSCGETVNGLVTVSVNQLPAVTVTPSTATYCNPGTAVAIAATGADTYAWLPITGLDVANAANVNSSPSATITYTVTGTDALTSCTNTATVTITSAATPTLTATATPSTPVCAGDTVQLNSSAVIPFTYVQSTETFSLETLPATAGPSGDDFLSAALPLGFGFNYYGVNYTQFAISTNGNIQLGNGSGTANNPAYNNQWTDAAIPNAAVPNNMIALAWDDWDITAGQIRYGVTGVSPNQKMVVSFVTTGRGAGGADTLDGQIVLEETTNKIYMNINKKGIQAINTATQGLENQTGGATSTVVVGRNNQAWSLNKETRVFTPYSGTYTYTWSPSASLNDPTIANPAAQGIQTSTVYSITAIETSGCSASATVSVTVNPLPVVSLGTDITACTSDLPTTLDAGNAGLTFLWSTSDIAQTITATSGGNYSVIVTDANGCKGRDTLVIIENANPTVTLGTDTTRCGGSVTMDAANAGANYLWNDNTTAQTLTATATGTYSVVVTDANGCTGNDTIDVTINTQPSVNLGNDTTICGTVITLDAGNVGLSFLWNDNSTNQTLNVNSSASYFVEVTTPQNCVAKDTILVTIAAPVVVNLGSDAAVCLTTINVLDAQNTGATYLWNDNSTNQTLSVTGPGTFAVEVTSVQGCTAKDTVVFTDNSPVVTFALPFSSTCIDAAVNVLSGESPVGGTFSGTGVTGSNFDATLAGAGSVTIDYTYTDGISGCSATASSVVVVDPCIGIDQFSSTLEYNVYPNPTSGQFEILVPSKEVNVKAMLYSADGKLVYSSELSGRDSYNVNISEFANGVYFLKLYVDGGVKIIKVAKQF